MAASKKYIFITIILALLIAGAFYFTRTPNNASDKKATTSPEFITPSPPKDTLAMPDSTQWLADSTHLYLIGNSRVTTAKKYPVQRRLDLDGTVFFDVKELPQSLIIKTNLLELSVSGKAALLVEAPAKEEWAEVQVLSGTVIAKKTYPSAENGIDTLKASQMLMINRSIDMMEKEKLDVRDLKAWRSRLP